MRIYHHTKFENLEKIIGQDCLSFRGSYYEEFSTTDYKWTKRVVAPIIEKICTLRKVEYDKDSSFKPIIISFGIDSESNYMWENYAQQYNGIQLILDYKEIHQFAFTKLDYFGKCSYMHKRGRMKKFIEYKKYNTESINDIQFNLEAVSALIKPIRFKKENEIRYIHSYSKIFEVNYEDYVRIGDSAFIDSVPCDNEKERFILFPKETLLGVRIGYNSSEKLNDVKSYLETSNYDLSKVNLDVYKP